MRALLTSVSLLLATPVWAQPAAPGAALTAPKKGVTLGEVAQSQSDPLRGQLDSAVGLLRSEKYEEAATRLYDLAEANESIRDEARYHLGKALYRLGLYHSALHWFSGLLEKGPQSRYYKSALEWCLFVGRKMTNDTSVTRIVAANAPADFPKDYRDEFLFRLARYHFGRTLAIESGAAVGATGEAKVQEKATGGLSVSGDVFGEEPPPEEEEAPPADKPKGSLSIDEDLFGDPEEDAPKKGKDKKGKKEPPPPPKVAPKAPKPEPKMADAKGELTAKEHAEAAKKLITRVDEKSPFGVRAKALEGVILYHEGKQNEALEAFKSVIRVTREGPLSTSDLREQAFFQLARTHYGAQQPSFSIFYYAKVDRDSYAWLDALYEASWAEFRLGTYEKALGNLLTLHSPFFTDFYYPESLILKAVIYYENCRYSEAKTILTDFLRRYEPILEELKTLTSREQTPAQYYEALENLRGRDLVESGTDKAMIMGQVLTIALNDPQLGRLDASFKEVDGELKALSAKAAGFPQSQLATFLTEHLGQVRGQLGLEAGKAVKNQLERERESIKNLVQQAIRIDIETSRAEQERIESQLREVQTRPKDIEKTFVEWADDEKLVWPFEGEYWRDELGTYELTLAHSCR